MTETVLVELLNLICSGIAYDALKEMCRKGVDLMRVMSVLFTVGWAACGHVV
jgi:hypothetical protein